MDLVVFENEGEIDVRSICTFGVSVKESDNPIGFFGTGLKYAIAIMLRTGHRVTIQSGLTAHAFDIKGILIRGKEFDVVTRNGEEMPFTTELGKTWELWQAFREAYCNCLDEGGMVRLRHEMPAPRSGTTRLIIDGDAFLECYAERGKIVLDIPEDKLLGEIHGVQVFNQPSPFMYYRRIRVASLEEPSLLTYNILSQIQLTEDRTAKYDHELSARIPPAISGLRNKAALRAVLTAEKAYESHVNFGLLDYYPQYVSSEFNEVLGMEYNLNNDKLNGSAAEFWSKKIQKDVRKNYEKVDPAEVEAKQLTRCQVICRRLFPDFDDYALMVVKDLGQNTMALADANIRTMVISQRAFAMGTKYLLSTMIEEYAHLKTGYKDHTRELQTWLFDTICTVTENHILKEPI